MEGETPGQVYLTCRGLSLIPALYSPVTIAGPEHCLGDHPAPRKNKKKNVYNRITKPILVSFFLYLFFFLLSFLSFPSFFFLLSLPLLSSLTFFLLLFLPSFLPSIYPSFFSFFFLSFISSSVQRFLSLHLSLGIIPDRFRTCDAKLWPYSTIFPLSLN